MGFVWFSFWRSEANSSFNVQILRVKFFKPHSSILLFTEKKSYWSHFHPFKWEKHYIAPRHWNIALHQVPWWEIREEGQWCREGYANDIFGRAEDIDIISSEMCHWHTRVRQLQLLTKLLINSYPSRNAPLTQFPIFTVAGTRWADMKIRKKNLLANW